MKPFFLIAGVLLLFVALCSGAIGAYGLYEDQQAVNMREVTFAELSTNPPKVGEKFKLTDYQLMLDGYFMVTHDPAGAPVDDDPESWGSAYIPLVALDSPADETVMGFEYILSSSLTQDDAEIRALAQEPFLVCTIQRARLSEELRQYQADAPAQVLLSFPETDLDQAVVLRHGAFLGGTGAGWVCTGTGVVIGVIALLAMALGLFLPKPQEPQPYMGGQAGGQPGPVQDDVWPGAGGPTSSTPSQPQAMSPFGAPDPPPAPQDGGYGSPPANDPYGAPPAHDPFGAPPAQNPYGAPPPVPAPPMGHGYGPQTTSGLAIASMICGIAGLLCCGLVLPSLAAVITGHIAMGQIGRSQGQVGGRGMAIAGLVTGYIGIVVGVLYIISMIASAATNTPTP